MAVAQLAEAWRYKKEDPTDRLPVRTIAFNKCPAVAPVGVLDASAQERLKIDLKDIEHNLAALRRMTDFPDKLRAAQELLAKSRDTRATDDADVQLYDGFLDEHDKGALPQVRALALNGQTTFDGFHDQRLRDLLPRYIARNFPGSLSSEQREQWETFRSKRLLEGGELSRVARFVQRLQVLAAQKGLTKQQRYLIEELQLYAESIMPNEAF
jgi:exodeoxyribonuclease-1